MKLTLYLILYSQTTSCRGFVLLSSRFVFFSSAVLHSIIRETVRAAVRSSGSVIKSFRNQYCKTKQLLVFSNLMAANCLLPLQNSCPPNDNLNRSFAPLTLIVIGEMGKVAYIQPSRQGQGRKQFPHESVF